MCLSLGTEILTVQAADNDDPKTDNVRIFYRLVGQIPESPRALFRVDRDSGVISVQADSMEGTAPQYTLTITAEDAKGDFASLIAGDRALWFKPCSVPWKMLFLFLACCLKLCDISCLFLNWGFMLGGNENFKVNERQWGYEHVLISGKEKKIKTNDCTNYYISKTLGDKYALILETHVMSPPVSEDNLLPFFVFPNWLCMEAVGDWMSFCHCRNIWQSDKKLY